MPNMRVTLPLRAVLARLRPAIVRLALLTGTIRGRILCAFLVMSVITAALGGYAALGIKRAGVLVAKTFDESLMSINYARAAAADFTAMQAAFARRWSAPSPAMQAKLDQDIATLEQTLSDDLGIAAERSQSSRAARAASNVQHAVDAWSDKRRHLPADIKPNTAWEMLDPYANTVSQQIDLLINYTAGDGFTYRQSARHAVTVATKLDLLGTAVALVLSALVAWLLAQRITGPVADASAVAKRIASGKLDGAIPKGGADELGALLAAMGIMRDNIRAMMEREVAQRRTAQVRLADALESSREGIVVVDAERRIALANSQAADFFGDATNLMESGNPATKESDLARTMLAFDGNLPATDEVRLEDGRWLRVSCSATQDGGFIAVYSDISILKDQEAKLKATNLLLDAALDNMSQGLCLYDSEHRLKVVNRRFCEIFALSPAQLKPGIVFRDVIELSIAAGNHVGKSAFDLLAEEAPLSKNRRVNTRFQELSHDRVVAITRQPIGDGGWVATYEDVTERRRAEERIVFMARHDALTSLPNRLHFAERIDHAISQIGRSNNGFAILSLDLDHFKQVNDTLGHHAGDLLLQNVAQLFSSRMRRSDTVARTGGDEFAVILDSPTTSDEAMLVGRSLLELLKEPMTLKDRPVSVGASIGMAVFPADAEDSESLCIKADLRMYEDKRSHRPEENGDNEPAFRRPRHHGVSLLL